MLADQLIARAQRCAELNHMLAENADHEDAPDWIAEIALKALNRREDRHVAIVRSVQRIRNKIALFDSTGFPRSTRPSTEAALSGSSSTPGRQGLS